MDKETRIRERAYRIWQEEGEPAGKAEEHWDKARRQVEDEDGAGAPADQKKPAVRRPSRRKKTPAEAGTAAAISSGFAPPSEFTC